MPQLTAKYDNINLLRAFAALLVVVYHVIEHGRWKAFPQEGPLVAFRIGWIGVDLFFVISGFVIAYSGLILYRKAPAKFAGEYWRRRLARILPLYLLTLFAWLAFVDPGLSQLAQPGWPRQVFTHLAFIHNLWSDTHGAIDGPNWSLGVEMQFYVLVALAIGWIDRTPGWRIWLYGIAISWAWRAAMVELSSGDAWRLFVKSNQLPGCLDLFGAGIFLAKWVLDARPSPPLKGLACVLAAEATGYIAMSLYWPRAGYWDQPVMVTYWRTSLAMFFMFVVASAVALPQVISYRWLAPLDYLGEISYGIYLWHLFAVTFVIHHLGYRGIESLAYVLALTLAASALSWRYFEKPIMDFARKRPAALPAAQSVPETPARPPA